MWDYLSGLDFDLSRLSKVKSDGAFGLLKYGLACNTNSSIHHIYYLVTYGLTQLLYEPSNLRDFDTDLSRSLLVKSDGAVGIPTYDL